MAVVEACSRRLSITSCSLAPSSASAGSQDAHTCMSYHSCLVSRDKRRLRGQASPYAPGLAATSLLGVLLFAFETMVAANWEKTRGGGA